MGNSWKEGVILPRSVRGVLQSSFILYWLPALSWMAAIVILPRFLGSSLPSPRSAVDELIRSGIHVVEYGILALLLYRALREQRSLGAREPGPPGDCTSAPLYLRSSAPYILAFLIASLYAAFDEVQQGFIPNRQPSFLDFLADSLGCLLALAGITVVLR